MHFPSGVGVSASTNVKRDLRIIKLSKTMWRNHLRSLHETQIENLDRSQHVYQRERFLEFFLPIHYLIKTMPPPKKWRRFTTCSTLNTSVFCFFGTFSIRRQVIKKTEKVRKWHKNARLERLEWRAGWWFLWGLEGSWGMDEHWKNLKHILMVYRLNFLQIAIYVDICG